MSVSIKVAVRCRPFTIDDKLGVHLIQNGNEEGEINLINSDYTTTRFSFNWAWWSAYGFQRHIQSNQDKGQSMPLISQQDVYDQCGLKIKADLMEGNAVVLFAYGLSGSGKTFTVFGPDAPDVPEAWFKHSTPHPMWGLFPRLAYELFADRQDGWKITMKYFQNVVDTVRDLLSPIGEEKTYKSGMRKDTDGFMDIEWCSSKVLNSWDDLRKNFMQANAKKAISPTQFNHQSTRGHCIMTLEVEMPHPANPAMKQKGRVYVCDLAGTEPAGDIVYALYEKKEFPNGEVEHKFLGPHRDPRKTKELQAQGMKINLSLSEMAQFFMKMAETAMQKKLKPGCSIPGCNSYFLCKYLKDTMLQARTYLFCAVRPELSFQNYTFSTLGFAKNASVVKLQPKKAVIAASDAERKLMAELEALKETLNKLLQENSKLKKSGEEGQDTSQLAILLAKKQAELMAVLSGNGIASGEGNDASPDDLESQMMIRQREEYGRRGICLTYFEKSTSYPHFVNLDEDPFRSNRFMYLLNQPKTVFGPNGDIKLLSLTVVRDHCSVTNQQENRVTGDEKLKFSHIRLCGGKGAVHHNGKLISKGESVDLVTFDRVAIGGELLMFIHPEEYPGVEIEPPTAEFAVDELQAALLAKDRQAEEMLAKRMREFEEEKEKWTSQQAMAAETGVAFEAEEPTMSPEKEAAWQMIDREILDLLPKTKEAKYVARLMDRDSLTFDVALQRTEDNMGIPKVKVKVENSGADGTNNIFLDPMDFLRGFSVLKDELVHLRTAKENGREYTLDSLHDPVCLLFDNTFKFGTSTMFPEFMLYNLPTDTDEKSLDIKLVSDGFDHVGALEVEWTPLSGPDDDGTASILDVDAPEDLIGKPWTYKICIRGVMALPIMVSACFVQYEFYNCSTPFTTETVEANTHSPRLEYSYVHHVEHVTPGFIAWLKKPLQFCVWVSPYVNPNRAPISTVNPNVLPGESNHFKLNASERNSINIPQIEQNNNTASTIHVPNSAFQCADDEIIIKKFELAELRKELEIAYIRINSLENELSAIKLCNHLEVDCNKTELIKPLLTERTPEICIRNSGSLSPRFRLHEAKNLDATFSSKSTNDCF